MAQACYSDLDPVCKSDQNSQSRFDQGRSCDPVPDSRCSGSQAESDSERSTVPD